MKQLDKRSDFVPHCQGKLPNGIEWQSFFWEPFFLKDKTEEKAYRLVWYWEISNPKILIIHCHRLKNMKSKRIIKKNKDYFPHLSEEEINKLVEELSDPNLLPLSQKTEDVEEELLLIKVLKRKLKEGTIKVEMTNDGKLWLKTSKPILGGITQVNYKKNV